ncbi:MAG: polyphosphate kinase 2 [Planctomycetes bacterium]|nr:polyphosphate kinase 2 [Planctomycetota bacterium]
MAESLLPFDLDDELDRAHLLELAQLQLELLKLQAHLGQTRQRLLVIFEGRDAAGKGGAIFRFSQNLNPRYARTVALPKPTPEEQGQWHFQRYLRRLPNAGEIVFFDRSWYNRAVVEPVFGFCTEEERLRFLRQVVELETMLVEDGLHLVKLWFSIDRDVQAERLAARERNPLKRWKLSPIDRAAQSHWDDFTRYKETMFAATSTPTCPWTVIRGNQKKVARLEAIRHVLQRVDYPERSAASVRVEADPAVVTVLTS